MDLVRLSRFRVGEFDATLALFFDRKAVVDALTAAERRVLSKFGSFVRRRAKSSIRQRKAVSKPGQPPSSHTGLLRNFIYFSLDRDRQSVVVGPVRLNQVQFDASFRPSTGTGPELLEYGGPAGVLEWFRAGRWQRADLRSRRRLEQRQTRRRVVRVEARPYMNPAFNDVLTQNLPTILQDCVSK